MAAHMGGLGSVVSDIRKTTALLLSVNSMYHSMPEST